MIQEAILKSISDSGKSIRSVAIDCGVNYIDLYKFLRGKRKTFPIGKIEKVLTFLNLKIS